ncbi:ABC transporter substrate-binding protein [Cryobacterium melibiosiphilum]|uniref:ABC transporter substrate-binding protein n=1 Tax=Cryobacterium melibiosiphilum TaxID=995039 RepID=A0A3A5MHS9_9MICO|nr:extracellular solute-binding protein [Cryobacterium melibiosiphilum]RJT89740.1 ABC transporter substrate-binding protein [Cryobacterium melibiosiphilum]
MSAFFSHPARPSVSPRRRAGIRSVAAVIGLAVTLPLLAGCATPKAEAREIGGTLDEIIALAQEEGFVQLIAYPETWANYGESFAGFEAKYGVKVEVASPNASSGEELSAVKNLLGQSTQPDVLDIGYSFTQPAIDQELLDIYEPTLIDEVPDNLKDPEGYWVGAYYGVLSMGVNADEVDVPTSFADLKDEQYKGKITIGDPRDGASSLATVFAAALANGGSLDDIQPGIDYFADLATGGYLVNSVSNAAALSTGEAAVTFDWNYNYSGIEEEMTQSAVDLQVLVPGDGVFGNYYAQPITIDSPQPNAARLWVEWLLSDEGAISYAQSGAVPARYAAMDAAGTLPQEARDSLPAADTLEQIEFPSLEQAAAATELIVDQWGTSVAGQ